MERLGGLRRYAVVALQIVGVGVAYYATAWLGFLTGIVGGQVSPLWPATGIALVAFLFLGVRAWPGILAGAFLAELSFVAWQPALLTAVGNLLAPLCAYFLLRRVGFRLNLDRLRDALALVFLGAFVGMTVGTAIGTATQVAFGITPPSLVVPTAFTWWTGDVMGVIVVAPLLLALYQVRSLRAIRNVRPRRMLEGAALVVGSAVIVLISQLTLGAGFIAFPLIVLAAWRFRLLGATLAVAVASVIEIYAAIMNVGAFADRDLLDKMIILQIFNGSIALTGLLLAVAIIERDRARLEVERTVTRLGEVASHLERNLERRRLPPHADLPVRPGEERRPDQE
ncbi:MASE1 domain-containing protein [Actinopolymorpha pittospori]|uniref:Integral membrane sensor domain MASE1 n=1 Tax=Actinopolymorpha pittospori TaxID=648752 RepID=A0A927N2U3_9ACTN|nr:integral membrane sensor domain MASE1 [Actinopolymorpha pittospori]